MATKYCPTHGSVDTNKSICPQCSSPLQDPFDWTKNKGEAEVQIHCQKCGTQHFFKASTKPIFCTACGSKFKNTLPKTPPRVVAFENGFNEIIISEMLATVTVKPSKANAVVVTVTGDEETKHSLKMDVRLGAMNLSAPLPFEEGGNSQRRSSSNVVITSGSFFGGMISGTSMNNGQLFIDGRVVDMDREVQVEIEVPFGTRIKIGKLIGTCHIGDVNGDLITDIEGMTKVLAGTVKSVNASISGSGGVAVKRIDGGIIEACVSGSSYIRVQDGNSSVFNASVSGSGYVTFRGVAETANMTVSGSGVIYLGECKTTPIKRKSGSGSIRVGRAPKGPES